MKIVQFTAENVKKLKVVDITPTKDFIQITGANGSGKSSVLDSIWWALAGTKVIQDQPIRQGEDKATIRLNLGDIIVTRRFTKSGTTLSVENGTGFKAPSPQAMLDAIIGHLSFDPLEFSRMDAKGQFDTLRHIADVKVDFEAFAEAEKKDTEKRRDINRDIKTLEGQIAGIQVADDTPDAPVDVRELMSRLTVIEDANSLAREEEIALENEKRDRQKVADKITTLKVEMENLEIRLRQYDDALAGRGAIVYQSTDDIKAQIANAEQHNTAYNSKKRKGELNADIALKQKASDEITEKLAQRAADKVTALQASKMPIPGLSLGDGHVLFNAVPFAQLSSAEQLRVSTAIAMAANPKLRVIRIKDGSLLDDNGLKMIQDMAAQNDYQVWCERVETTGKIGIVMEDGEVAAVNE